MNKLTPLPLKHGMILSPSPLLTLAVGGRNLFSTIKNRRDIEGVNSCDLSQQTWEYQTANLQSIVSSDATDDTTSFPSTSQR